MFKRIAEFAREAADAKKEFVEANKEVKDGTDSSNNSLKKDKYKDKSKISEDDYIYMDTRSITVGTLDEMYEKGLLFKSRPAREFIDFKNNSFDFELLSAYIDENF